MPPVRKRGECDSPEYKAWTDIKRRCYRQANNNFHLYGARGISMCARWRNDYGAFLADMGRRPTPMHSIDRIDNNGHYRPENCRWATRVEQARNKRTNAMITAFGRTLCIADWASHSGVSARTIWHRLRVMRWHPEHAVSVPVKRACDPAKQLKLWGVR